MSIETDVVVAIEHLIRVVVEKDDEHRDEAQADLEGALSAMCKEHCEGGSSEPKSARQRPEQKKLRLKRS